MKARGFLQLCRPLGFLASIFSLCLSCTADLATTVSRSASTETPLSDDGQNSHDDSLSETLALKLGEVLADGIINALERKSESLELVEGAASGSSQNFQYSVIASTEFCETNKNYSKEVPKANDTRIKADGVYLVCGKFISSSKVTTHLKSKAFIVDTVAPIIKSVGLDVAAATSATPNAPLVTAVIASGHDPDLTEYRIATGSTICDASLSYKTDVPVGGAPELAASGTYKICVKVSSEAENVTYGESTVFTLDLSEPEGVASLANGAADGIISLADRTTINPLLTVTVHDTDAALTIGYKIVSQTTACDGSLSYGDIIPQINSSAIATDGVYKACVKLSNVAGRSAYLQTAAFTVDITPPESSPSLINEATDGHLNLAERSSGNALVAAGSNDSSAVIAYAVAPNSSACPNATFSATVPKANSSALASDGSYVFCIKLVDPVGNSSIGWTPSLAVDTVAPTSSPSLVNEALDSFINLVERSTTHGLVASGVTDTSATVSYAIAASSGACSGASFTLANPQGSDAALANDGSYVICVKVVDLAGNTSASTTPVFVVDATQPIATPTLTNEAADGFLNLAERATSNALISAGADDLSAVITYAIAANSAACTTAAYGTTLPRGNSASFATDGTYVFCVKLVDAAKNESIAATSPLVVDTVLPTVSNMILSVASISSTTATLSWFAATDDTTSTGSLRYRAYSSPTVDLTTISLAQTAGSEASGWVTGSTSTGVTGLKPGHNHYLNVIVQDAAGNGKIYTSKAVQTTMQFLGATAGTASKWGLIGFAADSAAVDASLGSPRQVAIKGGYLYVSDLFRVHKFNLSTGDYVGWIGVVVGAPSGGVAGCTTAPAWDFSPGWCLGSGGAVDNYGFREAHGLALDDAGYLYVSVGYSSRIEKFNAATGAHIGWIGLIDTSPTGGAAGCSGAAAGTFTPGWCTGGIAREGTGDGALIQARGLAIYGNWLVASDYGNHRLVRFNKDDGSFGGWIGNVATTPSSGAAGCDSASAGTSTPGWCFGGTAAIGNGDGRFSYPNGLHIDAAGTTLYAADWGNARIVKIDPSTGSFSGWMGWISTQPSGGDSGCTSAAIGARTPGWCLGGTADTVGNTFFPTSVVTDGNGKLLLTSGRGLSKYDVATAADEGWLGTIRIAATGGAAGCDTAAIGTFAPGYCTGGMAAPSVYGFSSLGGLAADASGNVYVADYDLHRVDRISPTGQRTGWIGIKAVAANAWVDSGTRAFAYTDTTYNGARALTTDSSGSLYLSGNSSIMRYDMATGNFLGWLPLSGLSGSCPAGSQASSLAPNWCVGENFSNAGGPTGMVAQGGVLYVASLFSILKLNIATGALIGTIGTSGTGEGQFPNYIGDVAVDSSGNVYVSEPSAWRVSKFDQTGAYVGWIGRVGASSPTGGAAGCSGLASGLATPGWCRGGVAATGTGDGMFDGAAGVFTGGDGMLYVTDSNTSRVSRFNTATGAFQGWTGRVGAAVPTSGSGGCTTKVAGEYTDGWCYGGLPSDPRYLKAFLDGEGRLYVASEGRILKFNAATGTFLGWRGQIGTSPTGGDPGCNGATGITPGFCLGGSPGGSTADWYSKVGGFFFNLHMTKGNDDHVYVFDSGQNNTIGNRVTRFYDP